MSTRCWVVDSSSREFEYIQSPIANAPFPATFLGPQAAPRTLPVNTVLGKIHRSASLPAAVAGSRGSVKIAWLKNKSLFVLCQQALA